MVLNVQDEIINGTPKYNITPNGDGTSNIELANEVVSEGTNLNRVLFNKIENVLSYQIPSYTQTIISQRQQTATNIKVDTMDQTFSQSSLLDYISGTLTNYIQGQNATWKYTTDTQYGLQCYNTTSDDRIGFFAYNYSTKYTSADFLSNEKLTSYTGQNYNGFNIRNGKHLYKTFDFIYKSKPTFRFRFEKDSNSTTLSIEASDDNTSWTTLTSYSSYSDYTYTSPDYYRYYRINITNPTSSGPQTRLNYMYISTMDINIEELENEFSFVHISELSNNQRILINTPTNLDTSGVVSNKLNNILIDSILEANKFYELVYNQSQNKFIAHEVLN